jgi:hypothetical protein
MKEGHSPSRIPIGDVPTVCLLAPGNRRRRRRRRRRRLPSISGSFPLVCS